MMSTMTYLLVDGLGRSMSRLHKKKNKRLNLRFFFTCKGKKK